MEISIGLELAAVAAGALAIGFFVGYAVKKAMKILAILLGLYIISLGILAYYDIVIFNTGRIEELLYLLYEKIASYVNSLHVGLIGELGIYTIPIIAFLIGFLKGFKTG